MTTSAHTAILAQAAALGGIAISAGYYTNLGAAIMPSPQQPDGDDLTPAIFRSGDIAMEAARDEGLYRMTITWAALVIGNPDQIDGLALEAQSDLVKALRTVCGSRQIARLSIPAREPGSNAAVAAVSITTTIQEP